MSNLIDALLQLSRIGRAALRPVSVDLSAMATEILAELASSTPGHRVTVDIEPGMHVRADARLLNVALTNLLDNAWKYSARSERPHIEFGQQSNAGRPVFYVRDNGIGFDMHHAGKLFGAFQRLHGSEFPGTGIGLATVQRIIRRHGGRVWAEGETGRGAVFYFTLEDAPVEFSTINSET